VRRGSRIAIGMAALALVVAIPFTLLRDSDRSAFGQAVRVVGTRISHAPFDRAWRGFCSGSTCVVPIIAQIEVATPTDADTVDLVLAATFDYRITAGDTALVSASLGRPGQPGVRPLLPGQLEIQSGNPKESDSTTLTWAIDGVAARGAHYFLRVDVAPYDASHNGSATVSGQKGLLVAYASA
jgi:hypothetical protein